MFALTTCCCSRAWRDAALVFWQPAAASASLTQHLYGSEKNMRYSGRLVRFTSVEMNRQPCLAVLGFYTCKYSPTAQRVKIDI